MYLSITPFEYILSPIYTSSNSGNKGTRRLTKMQQVYSVNRYLTSVDESKLGLKLNQSEYARARESIQTGSHFACAS